MSVYIVCERKCLLQHFLFLCCYSLFCFSGKKYDEFWDWWFCSILSLITFFFISLVVLICFWFPLAAGFFLWDVYVISIILLFLLYFFSNISYSVVQPYLLMKDETKCRGSELWVLDWSVNYLQQQTSQLTYFALVY